MSNPFGMWAMMRGDVDRDDPPPACPFCGHPVDEIAGIYICGDCAMSWDSLDALQADAIGDDEE